MGDSIARPRKTLRSTECSPSPLCEATHSRHPRAIEAHHNVLIRGFSPECSSQAAVRSKYLLQEVNSIDYAMCSGSSSQVKRCEGNSRLMLRARPIFFQLVLTLNSVHLSACEEDGSSLPLGTRGQHQHAIPHSIELTNISECDAYLAWYEDCIESTLPTWQREQALVGLSKSRDQWVGQATTAFKKQSTARMCEGALRSAKEEFEGGCFGSNGAGGGTSSGGSSSAGGGSAGTCNLSNAAELGVPDTAVTLSTNTCMKVESGYPGWWGVRNMALQSQGNGTYPVTVTWSNSCANSSGSITISADWQHLTIGPINDDCATLLSFSSSRSGSFGLKYQAN